MWYDGEHEGGQGEKKQKGSDTVERRVIKLCPFCGADLYIEKVMTSYMPLCSNKSCIVSEDGYWGKTEEEAIEAANKRAL